MDRRLTQVILTCLLFGAVFSRAFGQDAAKLEYKFVNGQTLSYKLALEMTISTASATPGGEHRSPATVKITGIRTQQVRQIFPNGDAEVLYKHENMKISSGTGWQNMPPGQMSSFSMLISKDGTVRSIRGLEKTGPLAQLPFLNPANIDQCLGVLPPIPLKNDAKWTQEIPLPDSTGSKSTGTLKIQGQIVNSSEKLGDIAVVRYSQTVDGSQGFTQSSPPNSQASLLRETGTIQAKAVHCFAAQSGCLALSEGTGLVKTYMAYEDDKGKVMSAINTGILVKYQLSLIR
ncbi:MAG TPA: hypothetical protein VGK34_02555 [Armatimonadota bacterium]|jgi:hypothetical protein